MAKLPPLLGITDPQGQAWMFTQDKALEVISDYGQIDGGHHKQWVLDQVARELLGEKYDAWVVAMKDGEDGPDTYGYDEGIAP